MIRQRFGDLRHFLEHDLTLPLNVGIINVEVKTTTLQSFGEVAGVVGCQKHQRYLGGFHRAQLRHRDLVVAQHFQQQGLGFHFYPVYLVYEQHHGFAGSDGFQQRAGEQERLGENALFGFFPRAILVALGLDAQKLLLVVPLVEGFGFVQPFVALQADETGAGELGYALGQLRLACAGRAFDQHWFSQPVS